MKMHCGCGARIYSFRDVLCHFHQGSWKKGMYYLLNVSFHFGDTWADKVRKLKRYS